MTRVFGPMELIVIGFQGNGFDGSISAAVADLVTRGIVRIIDLAVVIKDPDGTVHILEMQELSLELAAAMATLIGETTGLLSEADLDDIASDLAPGATEAVFLVEHLWATNFAGAVRAAGGTLLLSERIPAAVIDAARATLIAAADMTQ
jgi:Family of unknown function (DUF6325)